MIQEYEKFIINKRHLENSLGLKETLFLPEKMFDFQKHVCDILIRKGRYACFLDTGLGKTLVELTAAYNYVLYTNRPVLILTPLAVAYQYICEAEKFGIPEVSYSRDGKLSTKIVLCNYEMLHKFNPNDFDCVILDESSILKNFDGKIKNTITYFLKKIKYRFLFTATPSPNDFIELGTSSEALGYMGYTDMLTRFFKNNEDTIKPQNIGTKWRLKAHAENDFFDWVKSWSISVRKPSDIGFDDSNYILPNLITNYLSVKNDNNLITNGQYEMFARVARSQTEVRQEQRLTIQKRCEFAVEKGEKSDIIVYWCNLNDEGDLLQSLDKDAYQITGSMSIDKKEDILFNFQKGNIKRLITKPKITAFGLNWQHCNHTTYFPTFSYEQWYQAMRRFHRFGQERDVIADIIYSDGQKRVIDSLMAKMDKSNKLYTKLSSKTNREFHTVDKEYNKQIILPNF